MKVKNDLQKVEDLLASQWDSNVLARLDELKNEKDATFKDTLCRFAHCALNSHAPGVNVLDFGCGLGFLANYLVGRGHKVTGIDISSKSVAVARSQFPPIPFFKLSAVDFAKTTSRKFDACIANMVFHNISSLGPTLNALNEILARNGVLIGTLPNREIWFKRRFEFATKAEFLGARAYLLRFKIQNCAPHPSHITYFERPSEEYWHALRRSGFSAIEAVQLDDMNVPDDLLFFVARKQP